MPADKRLDRRYLTMPHVERGMVVGLFGGSFNPPHAGHALVAEIALRRLGLDQLWWMVTPGNPLKSRSELASLEDRIAACEKLVHDPRIKVTAFEKSLGISYTANTLAKVKAKIRTCASSGLWVPIISRVSITGRNGARLLRLSRLR